MKSINAIVQTHALAAYTTLCFLLSSSVVLYVGIRIPPPDEVEVLLPAMVASMLLGPSIAGVGLSLAKYGVDGTGERLRERYRWKNYYALYALFAPTMVASVLGLMSVLVSREVYAPAILIIDKEERLSLILMGLGYGLAAGVFEELGWSFFAVPEMLKEGKGELNTAFTIGLIWGMWHFLVAIYGSGDPDGKLSFDSFMPWIPWNLLALPAYRVAMVCVFAATGGSCWPMTIMHGTLTACLPIILGPTRATGAALASFYSLFALALVAVSSFCLSVFNTKEKSS